MRLLRKRITNATEPVEGSSLDIQFSYGPHVVGARCPFQLLCSVCAMPWT